MDLVTAEGSGWNGSLLYIAFYRGELPGWSTAITPGKTRFEVVDAPPPC